MAKLGANGHVLGFQREKWLQGKKEKNPKEISVMDCRNGKLLNISLHKLFTAFLMKRKDATYKIIHHSRCGSWRIGFPHNTSRSGFQDLVEGNVEGQDIHKAQLTWGNVEGQEIHKSQRIRWIKCIRPRDSQNNIHVRW